MQLLGLESQQSLIMCFIWTYPLLCAGDKDVLEVQTLTVLHELGPLLILKQCSLSDHRILSE